MKIDRRAFMAAVLAPFAAMSNVGQNLLKFRQEGGVTDLTEKMRLHPLRASRFTDAQHIMLKSRQIGNTETTHALLELERHLEARGQSLQVIEEPISPMVQPVSFSMRIAVPISELTPKPH